MFNFFDEMRIVVGVMPYSNNDFKAFVKCDEQTFITDDLKNRKIAVAYIIEHAIEMLEKRIINLM